MNPVKPEVKKEKRRIARTNIAHSSLPNLNNQALYQSNCFNTFKNAKSPTSEIKPIVQTPTEIPSLSNPQSSFYF